MGFWWATSGTWINLAAVLLGTLVGWALGRRLHPALGDQWRRWLGVITLLLGLAMARPLLEQRLGALPAVLPALLALVLGSALGTGLDLEARLGRWLARHQPTRQQPAPPQPASLQLAGGAEAPRQAGAGILSGAFLLFCVGPMTLLGCLRNGALGEPDLLLVKACLDGVSSAVLASSVGLTLAWVLLPMALLQLPLSLAGAALALGSGDPTGAPVLIFSAAVGGLLVIGLALELLELPHPSVSNAMPALLLAPLLGWGVH
jgi:uncharacterized membrane protein YqgA involved in biofilm formation